MIDQLKEAYPVERLCTVLEMPRSSYYYQAVNPPENGLTEAIEQLLLRRPFFGYRRIQAQLKREGRTVNHKVIRHIMKTLGIERKVGRVRIRTTDSSHPHWRYPNRIQGLPATRPDQICVLFCDFDRGQVFREFATENLS